MREDNKFVGLVFDYENDKNYRAFVVSKKEYVYYSVEKGERSIVKQGLVKPGKLISQILLKYDSSKIEFLLNGIEVTTLKRISLNSSQLGIIIEGKTKAVCKDFMFYTINSETEHEESTSDT